jgi:hypothetical protein
MNYIKGGDERDAYPEIFEPWVVTSVAGMAQRLFRALRGSGFRRIRSLGNN